jgi:hypothetical protein
LKRSEEVMEILEAFDLTGTLRGAVQLVGCDHKTVARWVRARDEAGGGLPVASRPRPRVDAFAVKIEECVDRSRGRLRADVCHQRLVAMGYMGSERTTRRAVAGAKRRWRAEHGRRTGPWVVEPGLWMQCDYGDGPIVEDRETVLFCALDRTLRAFGGAPTYALTDNEKTVWVDHVCGIAVRNPTIVAVARHYGLTIATCVPADPESRVAVRRPFGSPRPTLSRPITTCATPTLRVPSWSARARSSVSASTRVSTRSPGARAL